MAGRVTHWQDWAEKEGGWEPVVTLKNGARIGLENALGRKLTKNEIAEIEKDIAPLKFLKEGFSDATFQDVKRSLRNIGKLPPSEAFTAYRKSDSTTQALIDEAMYLNLGVNPDSPEWMQPRGENIAKAAIAAREYFKCGKGGRPRKLYREHLASYALSLWARLGRDDCAAWVRDDAATPIVRFMASLASVVDDEMLDMGTAAELLKGRCEPQKIKR